MAMNSPLYLPALQAQFGSWVYYSCVMRLADVRDRVSYAREIHKNTALSDMIQRELDDEKRRADIEQYLLKTKDRFFNSLVVGVYGGNPQWHPFEVKARAGQHSELQFAGQENIGYLELDGKEHLFALDGQHRLSGIKAAVESRASLGDERVSVLFVAHATNAAGLRRTRSLFVAINKKAVQVRKRDIIALDEVDHAAIITRQLVDEHDWFSRGQVDVDRFTDSIPAAAQALTTIGSFYDIVRVAIGGVMAPECKDELVAGDKVRLSDARLSHFRGLAEAYFESLVALDQDLKLALSAKQFGALMAGGRDRESPRLLFRPIGMMIVTRALAHMRKTRSLKESLKLAKAIPLLMTDKPFVDVIYDPVRNRMMTTNKNLCLRLLLYMLDAAPADAKLRAAYAKHLGRPVEKIRLPNRLV
jgi:DNA sulfur modification protein DndB